MLDDFAEEFLERMFLERMEIIKDFPASKFQALVGRTIVFVADHPNADEGFRITLDDGSVLDVGFSGCEGTIAHDA